MDALSDVNILSGSRLRHLLTAYRKQRSGLNYFLATQPQLKKRSSQSLSLCPLAGGKFQTSGTSVLEAKPGRQMVNKRWHPAVPKRKPQSHDSPKKSLLL